MLVKNKNLIIKILVGAAIGFLFLSLVFNIYDVSLLGLKASANGFSIMFSAAQAVEDMVAWLVITSVLIIAASITLAVFYIKQIKSSEITKKLQIIVCVISVVLTFIYMINSIVACGKFYSAVTGSYFPFIIEVIIVVSVIVLNYLKEKE